MRVADAAARVIDLARKVREYYAAELPKWHPNYPVIDLDEPSAPPPPEEEELRSFLTSLSEETMYALLLIMYLGRGDFGAHELAESYEVLTGTFTDPDHAAAQMMGKAPAYIEELVRESLNVLRPAAPPLGLWPALNATIRGQLGRFHTPNTENIDKLVSDALGLQSVQNSWT